MVMVVIHVTVIERVIIVTTKIIANIMFFGFSEIVAGQVCTIWQSELVHSV